MKNPKTEPTQDSFACPECDMTHNTVIDSRQVAKRRRRRRECDAGHRFTTYEVDAQELNDMERKLAEFREWQMQMRYMLRSAA